MPLLLRMTIELVEAPPEKYLTPLSRSPSDTPVAAKNTCAVEEGGQGLSAQRSVSGWPDGHGLQVGSRQARGQTARGACSEAHAGGRPAGAGSACRH